MSTKANDKPCIACAEPIKAGALLCKHCGTRQDDPEFQIHSIQSKPSSPKQVSIGGTSCPKCGNPDSEDFYCSLCGEALQNEANLKKNRTLNAECPRCGSYAMSAGVCDTCGFRDLTSNVNKTRSRVRGAARVLQSEVEDESPPIKTSGISGFALASWGLVIVAIVGGVFLWNPSTSKNVTDWISSTGPENPTSDSVVQNTATIDSSFAEEFIRQTLFERTGVSVIAECPDLMQGIEGDKFTCYACPELYAAPEAGGGYFYGPGTVEFRCDAAFEGFAVDYEVVNGEMILMMEEIRGATE